MSTADLGAVAPPDTLRHRPELLPVMVVPPLVPEPLVNGSSVLLKYQVGWEMPEQVSLPPVPGQPPLSRCRAQNDSVLTPLLCAQLRTVPASASVKVSSGP